MTRISRLIFNLILPLILFNFGYFGLYWLGSDLVEGILLQFISIGLSLLLASLPPLVFRFLIRSQIKNGFALLKSGKIVTPDEITIGHVLGNQLVAWEAFAHHLDTEVCLQGDEELVYIKLRLDFSIPANKRGKLFVKHLKTNMTVFEIWVQRAIFIASAMERGLAHSLASSKLMNEEDENVLRSKILSALEMQPLKSLVLPSDTSGITVSRDMRVVKKETTGHAPGTSPATGLEQIHGDAIKHDDQPLEQLDNKLSS